MDIKYGDYAITHDGYNFVVNKVSIVGPDKAKPENVGKVAYKKLKYYSTLKSALKSMRDMLIVDAHNESAEKLNHYIYQIQTIDNNFMAFLDGKYEDD